MILNSKYLDKRLCYECQLGSHPFLTSQTRGDKINLQKKISSLQLKLGAATLGHVMFVGIANG